MIIKFKTTTISKTCAFMVNFLQVTTKPILIYPNSGETYDADRKEWLVSWLSSDDKLLILSLLNVEILNFWCIIIRLRTLLLPAYLLKRGNEFYTILIINYDFNVAAIEWSFRCRFCVVRGQMVWSWGFSCWRLLQDNPKYHQSYFQGSLVPVQWEFPIDSKD